MTEGFGERIFNQNALGRTEAGDECPLCQNGTVEIVSEVVGRKPRANPSDLQLIRNRETKCMGECGNTAPTHPSISPGPGYTLGRDETTAHPLAGVAIENLGGDGFSAADLLTVRNLLHAFETHLSDEASRLDVPVETLCPCHADEVKAARELLYRLDPLMVL